MDIVNVIGSVFSGLTNTAQTWFKSDVDKKKFEAAIEQSKDKILLEAMNSALEIERLKVSSITAEANSDSWLTASWRPLLMTMFGLIIFINYIGHPIFGWPKAEIPPDMWDLLKLGVGGYTAGRSIEKIVKNVRG